MGLSRSLGAGASSLRAHQQKFDVISNNLANASTIGFKSSRLNFADQLSQTRFYGQSPDSAGGVGSGGMNPRQIGLGVKVGSIVKDMSQGAIETTNRPLDMALNGEGFFVYSLGGTDMFSRAGATIRDTQGFLVDSNSGAYLQGYNVEMDANGRPLIDAAGNNQLSRSVRNIQIEPGVISQPAQTETVDFRGNLDRTIAEGDSRTTSIKIFDNAGSARELALTFTKTANPGEFTLTGTIGGADIGINETITFGDDGTLQTPFNFTLASADLNTALGGASLFDDTSDITLNLGDPSSLTTKSITNFSGNTDITAAFQDGYEAGDLVSLAVDQNGKVRGTFTNGRNEILAQVAVAKFTNPGALLKNGNNFYMASPNSGNANIGTALENFPTTSIQGSALEQSNVDLTRQFTDMISTQRAFEAASRTITVSDTMLAEVNNLKRV